MPPDSTPDAATLDEIRRFEAQYARSPESLVFARLADAYRKAGLLERAIEVVEDGLVRHPGYLSAHIVRGRTLRELGRPDAATAAFHRVLDVDPQNLVALRALGEIARERGRPEEARQWYERLAEVDPLDEQVRSTLESLPEAWGSVESGLEEWQAPESEARAWEPAETEPESARASESGPEAAHVPEFEPEAAHFPDSEAEQPPGVEDPGVQQDRPRDAEPDGEDGRELATLTMAELYMRQGLYEEAERVYRRLVRIRPDDPALREKLEVVRGLLRGGAEGSPGGGAETPPASEPAGSRPAPGEDVSTIRRYLNALLEGSAAGSEGVPRPSAFDAWLEREARR